MTSKRAICWQWQHYIRLANFSAFQFSLRHSSSTTKSNIVSFSKLHCLPQKRLLTEFFLVYSKHSIFSFKQLSKFLEILEFLYYGLRTDYSRGDLQSYELGNFAKSNFLFNEKLDYSAQRQISMRPFAFKDQKPLLPKCFQYSQHCVCGIKTYLLYLIKWII